MKDKRSLKAVDTAIAFGEGKATSEELNSAAVDAAYYIANYGADASGADASAYTAATSTAYYAAKIENQKETADIVRKYIPFALWNIQK